MRIYRILFSKRWRRICWFTGLYAYKEYLKDVFLNWFGVLPSCRGRGLGERIFKWTVLMAKRKGYKYFRLYTEKGDNDKAINLYRKMRMMEEVYNKEKWINNMIVFSKLLNGKKLRIWHNRFLGIFPAHCFYSDQPIKTYILIH
jgi:GNAT superfamily N-acetyltransferase